MAMAVVSTKNLTKYYGKNRGIIEVDLHVEQGEIYGFIGPNGAGKSTTIKLLLDFIRPTKGSSRIFGMDCIAQSQAIKRDVGYIPAEVNYYEGMKVSDLLAYSASYYEGDHTAYIRELCEVLDLDVSRKVGELSTGNKKKVSIVQAMLHRPKLLIMDEPTAGLDPLVQHVFYNLIKQVRDRGTTVFFSSHILSEVQRVCDRVGIIREGRLIKSETTEELTKTQYKRVRVASDTPLSVPGAEQVKTHNGVTEFLYKGPAARLLEALRGADITNVWIEDLPLEDIFMTYYQKEGK